MPPFSKRTEWEGSPNPLSEAADRVKKQGKKIFDLTLSNPTQAGFRFLKPGLLKSFDQTGNLSYHPDPKGLLKAREAVCSYYAAKNVRVSPEQIILTANTSEAYSTVLRLLADPGDCVLAPSPSYPLLDYLAGLNDVVLSRYPVRLTNNWGLDFSNIQTNAKAVILVNPNNPTGNYVKIPERGAIIELTKKNNCALIVDEVFFDFEVTPDILKAPTFAGYHEVLTFTLSGISKVLGLPQMKLSWIAVSGPEKIRTEALRRLEIINDTYLSASTPIQNALPDWMKHQAVLQEEISQRVRENLNLLKKLFGEWIPKVEGGWYALIKLPGGINDEETCLQLLEQREVLVHPGYLFDFEEPYLLISLLPEKSIFEEGTKRLRDFFIKSEGPDPRV